MRAMMTALKLTVNETKTRVCKLPEEKFDFLEYTFGRLYSPKTGWAYLGSSPSKKRVQRICKAISQETGRNKTLLAQDTMIKTLNRMMVGWANYFCLGPVSKAYRAVERHARKRLRQWLCAKHKLRGQATKQFSITTLHKCWALSSLLLGQAAFRGRNREPFSENRMREMRLSGSMSGNRKQSHAKPDLGARCESSAHKPPGDYRHCACSRLHSSLRLPSGKDEAFDIVNECQKLLVMLTGNFTHVVRG